MNPALAQVRNEEADIDRGRVQEASCMQTSQGVVAFDLDLYQKLHVHVHTAAQWREKRENCHRVLCIHSGILKFYLVLNSSDMKIPSLRPTPSQIPWVSEQLVKKEKEFRLSSHLKKKAFLQTFKHFLEI